MANLRFRQHFPSGHRECWAQVTLLDNWWWFLWSNDVLEQQNTVCSPCWKLGSRRDKAASSICRANFLSTLKSHINPFEKSVPGRERGQKGHPSAILSPILRKGRIRKGHNIVLPVFIISGLFNYCWVTIGSWRVICEEKHANILGESRGNIWCCVDWLYLLSHWFLFWFPLQVAWLYSSGFLLNSISRFLFPA